MKRIQNFYLFSYRMVGFIFLVGLISSILWYGFSMLFFIGSSSWGVPIILSPNQEKVMSHLEHVLVLEHNATKDIAKLSTLKQSLKYKRRILKVAKKLQIRLEKTMVSQSKQYAKNGRIFRELSKEKTVNLTQLRKLVSTAHNRESAIDKELKVGLITRQEALTARLASNKIHSDLVEAKARKHDLHQRSLDFSNAANTLNGSADNMVAMYKVVKKVELESQIGQLKSDIFSLHITMKQLKQSIQKKKNALTLMKNSPYIRATKAATTFAFVPYHNLKRARVGAPVYSCYLDMIFCYQAGQIAAVYQAEEYFPHPLFKSEIKGQLVGITFNNQHDGQKKLLFLNAKPLLL